MKWMDVFLEDGQMAGKIVCPNKKCGAKLGNFDWAGVCCGCKEWVVPVRTCRTGLECIALTSLTISGLLHPSLQGGRGGVMDRGSSVRWNDVYL